jgi:hypothetical protein
MLDRRRAHARRWHGAPAAAPAEDESTYDESTYDESMSDESTSAYDSPPPSPIELREEDIVLPLAAEEPGLAARVRAAQRARARPSPSPARSIRQAR